MQLSQVLRKSKVLAHKMQLVFGRKIKWTSLKEMTGRFVIEKTIQ
ncbi:hypothetical protein CIT292_07028 [Citrobacter youngae ATCC 29220]|uniref:Uncharacterized protein n=1 Tax=Citrobacter youngae ATCC 29220 TaxID=500640 RepID=D4B988_9ENTR|nr:hypothetical protein CIT292_07028 [Citrobacter youngae ATCC 29220]